jgi:hypothetical protein
MGTGSMGLVNLSEDESDLGVTLEVDDTSLAPGGLILRTFGRP